MKLTIQYRDSTLANEGGFMAIIEGIYEDAPEALGQMFIRAVRERNASLMNNLLRRPFLWGKYHQQLTKGEQQWSTEYTEKPPDDEEDYD